MEFPKRETRIARGLSTDPVVHVGDPALPLQNAGSLELDVLRAQAIEEATPSTEQHRYEGNLEFVDKAGREGELR
jgi:hypothetical protein